MKSRHLLCESEPVRIWTPLKMVMVLSFCVAAGVMVAFWQGVQQ